MGIIKNFKGTLYDYLGKKIDRATIQAIYDNAEAEYSFKKLALYIAISYIANAITKCEFKTYKNGTEEKGEEYYTLNLSPNVNQNSSQFWNKVIFKLYEDGEALVISDKGKMYCADSFGIDEFPILGNKFTNVIIDNFQFNKTFNAKDVLYFKLDFKCASKLIDETYEKYGKMLACAINAYAKSNSKKYKLIIKNIQAGDENFRKIFEEVVKKQLESFIKNDNAVYPQFEGYNLEEFGNKINAKDSSDVVALRKDVFETVASTLKIPIKMMYGDMNSVKDVVNQFLTFSIDPVADMIGEEITRKTGDFFSWNGGKNRTEVDTTCINHIDILDVAEKVDKLISSGFTSIDEAREKARMNPLNTEFGRKHWMTKNYSTGEEALKGGEDSEQS